MGEELDKNDQSFFEMDVTKERFLKGMITPDLKEHERFKDFFSKELKVSNIQSKDLKELLEITDLAFQIKNLGAEDFSYFLLLLRDTKLSATSSLKGFERLTEATSVNVHSLEEKGKTSGKLKEMLLGRG